MIQFINYVFSEETYNCLHLLMSVLKKVPYKSSWWGLAEYILLVCSIKIFLIDIVSSFCLISVVHLLCMFV